MPAHFVPIVFIAIAAIFAGAAVKNYRDSGGESTPARRAYQRVAFIFTAVALFVYLVQTGRW